MSLITITPLWVWIIAVGILLTLCATTADNVDVITETSQQQQQQTTTTIVTTDGATSSSVSTCWKDSYSRGWGRKPDDNETCNENEEMQGEFCFSKCRKGYKGFGSVCWLKCSSSINKHGNLNQDGILTCCARKHDCRETMTALSESLPNDFIQLVIDLSTGRVDSDKILEDFRKIVEDSTKLMIPLCGSNNKNKQNDDDDDDDEVDNNKEENDASLFSWVPSPECASKVKVCYQGKEKDIKFVAAIDPINPCRKHATVKNGSCKDFSFEKYVGKDPVFTSVDLYV